MFALCLLAAPAAAQEAVDPAALRPAVAGPDDARVVLTLTRSTLVALAQANETDDYSVLYALTSPRFRSEHVESDLAGAFAPMREARVDLLQAAAIEPTFSPAPVMDARGWLWIQGEAALLPRAMRFELAFEPVDGVWRLARIAVEPMP